VLAFALLFPPAYVAVAPDERPPAPALAPAPPRAYAVYVADWGYHTAVTLPQAAGWGLGPAGADDAPRVEYAWGDRRFYRDSDYRPWALFATLVLPTASVVYVRGRAGPPAGGGARAVYARVVDAATLARLAGALERSVRRGAGGARVAPAPPVPGYAGRFYDAHGTYLWARDCNRWTVDRLHEAGLARPGAGVLFPGQVPGRLLGFAAVTAPAPGPTSRARRP
jgi:hypothetical protein